MVCCVLGYPSERSVGTHARAGPVYACCSLLLSLGGAGAERMCGTLYGVLRVGLLLNVRIEGLCERSVGTHARLGLCTPVVRYCCPWPVSGSGHGVLWCYMLGCCRMLAGEPV
jgi:hypothetical protein